MSWSWFFDIPARLVGKPSPAACFPAIAMLTEREREWGWSGWGSGSGWSPQVILLLLVPPKGNFTCTPMSDD